MNKLGLRLFFRFARKVRKQPNIVTTQLKDKDAYLRQEIDQQLNQQIIPLQNQQTIQKVQAYQESIKKKTLKEITKDSIDMDPKHIDSFSSNKIVQRPNKGVVWGLGGQLMLAQKKIHLQGLKDNIDQIIEFLQLHQIKNIYVHDFHKEDSNSNRRRYSIIGSCFSAKHCWKTGLQLKNAFTLNSSKKKFSMRSQKYDPVWPSFSGSKKDEWSLVQYKDFQISLMTQEQRQAADLQWKWNNQVSEERLEKYRLIKLRKGRRNQFQPF